MSRDPTRRLGRGLAALLGSDVEPSSELLDARNLPVDKVYPNTEQPRTHSDPAALQELIDSVRQQGILQPLLVRPLPGMEQGFQIVAGERRWRAATAIGLATVPCIVQNLTDEQSAAAALVENVQRLDLNPLDEASGFERLMERFHLTQDALAHVIGKSRSHVANTLRLLKLPLQVRELVQTGRITAGHARALVNHPDPEAAAQAIVEGDLSVREAEKMARSQPPRNPTPADPDLVALERELAEQLGVAVAIRSSGGRGAVTLRFSTLEQLDYLLSRLGSNQSR